MVQPKITICILGLATVVITLGNLASFPSYSCLVYIYCSKCRFQANVIKSAVMVFSKDAVNGCWKWGEHSLPKVSSYS